MDFKIIWTLRSREDLREIATYISKDNPAAALKLGDLMFEKVESLAKFPEFGRIVPERNETTLRQIVVKGYRIIYRVQPARKTVEILRVWHGARSEPHI